MSVLILNWNRRDDLREALRSAGSQTYPNIQVVVVDNGSIDGSVEMVKESFPEVKLVRLHRNVGCPEGRNVGMINADGEYVFTLDNDGTIEPDVVEKVMAVFQGDPKVGVVTIKTVDYYSHENRPTIHNCDSEVSGYVAAFSGGASAIRKSILAHTGYYPHSYFYGGEENYLLYSIYNAGYLIYYLHTAVMFHKISKDQRNRANQFMTRFRNEVVTVWRYFPLSLAIPVTLRKYCLYFGACLKEKQLAAFLRALMISPAAIIKARACERVRVSDASIIMVQWARNRIFTDRAALEREFSAIREKPSYVHWLLKKKKAAP